VLLFLIAGAWGVWLILKSSHEKEELNPFPIALTAFTPGGVANTFNTYVQTPLSVLILQNSISIQLPANLFGTLYFYVASSNTLVTSFYAGKPNLPVACTVCGSAQPNLSAYKYILTAGDGRQANGGLIYTVKFTSSIVRFSYIFIAS